MKNHVLLSGASGLIGTALRQQLTAAGWKSRQLVRHKPQNPGFEFLYVVEGELEIKHGERTQVLAAGDSVYFDASTPHAYQCAGKTPAVVIIVTMHQQGIQHGTGMRSLSASLGARQSVAQASTGVAVGRGISPGGAPLRTPRV